MTLVDGLLNPQVVCPLIPVIVVLLPCRSFGISHKDTCESLLVGFYADSHA